MSVFDTMTVNRYLIQRLIDAGIEHVFGVPGDYALDFVNNLVASPLKWIGNCNELNAGYAADGYARVRGLGAVSVTYGVGAFSMLNAVTGAYSEQVPLIVISGAPHSARRQANALVHHLTKDYMLQFDIFSRVTADSAMLTNPQTAPDIIDRILKSCINKKQPVYLEIPLDIGKMPCRNPEPIVFTEEKSSDPDILKECIEEAVEMLNSAKNPVILTGVELLRFGLSKQALRLVEQLELPFAATLSSKSALPELHPQFIGLYQGSMSKDIVIEQVENSDCLISLGVWLTDFDTGLFTAYLDERSMINANNDGVKIKRHSYSGITLSDFINKLAESAKPRNYLLSHPAQRFEQMKKFEPDAEALLTPKRFYERINQFLDDNMIILSEPGDSIAASSEMHIEEADNYIAQAYYLSIGYCTPASLGVAVAAPDKRVVVLTGDGSFQMTAQEVSTHIRQKCNTIFILINNEGYLIERVIFDDGYYNDIQNWKYSQLPGVFGENCLGFEVRTEGEFEAALESAAKEKDKLVF
ncbi:MAG: hypothetical protein QG635_2201, partial [Bacteroidota bacterium]|nr:hypothetical protein [Bacteroidota bacterium]